MQTSKNAECAAAGALMPPRSLSAGAGAPPRGGMSAALADGYPPDWQCLKCGHVNFARRQECQQCAALRASDAPAAQAGPKFQPDWKCSSCGNINFARREECKQCSKARTADCQPAYAPGHASLKPSKGGKGGMPGVQYDPDWVCSSCQNINFARRAECRQCGKARSPDCQPAYAPGHANLKTRGGNPDPGLAGFSVGDWRCSCGFVNFAKRTECLECGAPKGGTKGATVRYSPY